MNNSSYLIQISQVLQFPIEIYGPVLGAKGSSIYSASPSMRRAIALNRTS